MTNPNFVRPVIPPVAAPRLATIQGLVTAFLAANAALADVDDNALVALAPEFSAVPGTLKIIKDRLSLT
jgi:hypothetical protein